MRQPVPHQVCEQAGVAPKAAGGSWGPRRAPSRASCAQAITARWVHPAQFLRRGEDERGHEMSHVELVGGAGLPVLLRGEPDFFVDGGELVKRGVLAANIRPDGKCDRHSVTTTTAAVTTAATITRPTVRPCRGIKHPFAALGVQIAAHRPVGVSPPPPKSGNGRHPRHLGRGAKRGHGPPRASRLRWPS